MSRAFNRLVAEHPLWAAGLLVVVAVAAWFLLRDGATDATSDSATSSTAQVAVESDGASVDPVSGLPLVAESALPSTAQDILVLIDQGGPFEFEQDGSVFGNYEGLLPDESHGYYHEYTVQMPGDSTRGAHRFVTGADGEIYWTDDHYASFKAVLEDE